MKNNSIPNLVVVSGAYPDVGKGIFTSSLGCLVQSHGYSVYPVKFDGYLNASSGTMNPYHARMDSSYSEEEVFVLEDGYEGDADSGYYERYLHNVFLNESNVSNGRLFARLAQLEREGKLRYGEILNYRALRNLLERWLLEIAHKNDFTFIEIGGTIGDKDNEILFDCLNLIKSHGKANIFTIMLSPYLEKNSEEGTELSYRSKITRLAFEKSWRQGVMPDAIVMRVSGQLHMEKGDLEYIGLETGLSDNKDVYADNDLGSIYDLPAALRKQGLDKRVLEFFGLPSKATKIATDIEKYAKKLAITSEQPPIRLAVFGKTMSDDSYVSLKDAIQHAGIANKKNVQIVWLDDEENWKSALQNASGLIVAEGLGFIEEKLQALHIAREKNIPTLAVSFGCSLMVKEFMENELKIKVSVEEIEGNSSNDACITSGFLRAGKQPISFGSSRFYKQLKFAERFRIKSIIGETVLSELVNTKLKPFATSPDKTEVFGVEHQDLDFYVGVAFHPEFISHPMHPHPLFEALVKRMK
jgi:CTP synthase